MPDPVTVNRGLAIPAHGSDVNTWDVPLNADFALIDTIVGGIASISTAGGVTTLNAAQLACGTISVSGALGSAATIVFSGGGTAVQGWWTVENLTTGNFALVAGTNGTENIAIPQGGLFDIQVNGGAVRFRNLPAVGSYLDLATSAVPLWIQNCTKAPYLLCDGSAFNGATYPQLAAFLGGTTLPDFRGRSSHYLNGATSRLTTGGAGIDGNTLFATGGANGITLAAAQIPSLTSSNASQNIAVASAHTYPDINTFIDSIQSPASGTPTLYWRPNVSAGVAPISSSGANSISVNYVNSSQQIVGNADPGIVSGIRLIRAA